jgi:cell division control protein 45
MVRRLPVSSPNPRPNIPLRLAVLGLTHQYLSSSISRQQYEHYYSIFEDEVARLNPPITTIARGRGDNHGVRPSTEFRFPLLKTWNLYDAMVHSGYVANKIAIWKEDGIKKLDRMLAKMG